MRDLAAWDALIWRAHLSLIEWEDAPDETDPFAGLRDAARQSTTTELRDLAPTMAEHAAHLTIARVTLSRALDLDRARRTPIATGPDDALTSLRDALLRALEHDGKLREAWIATAEKSATAAANAWRLLAEMRAEAARRLGVCSPDDKHAKAASELLHETRELAFDVMREPSLASAMEVGLARSAGEGWPKTPSVRFAVEALGEPVKKLADRARPRVPVPVGIGAASHARVFVRLGFEIAARLPSDVSFTRRQDPLLTGAHRVGLLFGAALMEPAFHRRILGCSARIARAQARAIALSAFLRARFDAARVAKIDPGERAELLFGKPPRADLARVLPRPLRDAGGRFGAWLALPFDRDGALDRHDEDWFRNPRFWEEITIRMSSANEDVESDARALGRWFEARIA